MAAGERKQAERITKLETRVTQLESILAKFRQGKLVRHHLSDRPDWQIMKDEIPLGTIYILIGEPVELIIRNDELKEERKVMCYYVIGGPNHTSGYMVADVLEVTEIK